MSKKKLYKSTDDKAIAGVCGGIAEYFDIDSLIVRLVFVLLTLAYAAGAVVYLVLALAMPKRQMSAAYAYSGAPGEAYAYGGFEPANDAARRFSAQVNGEETNSAYVSPQTAFSGMSEMAEAAGQEAEEVPVILQAQAAFEEPQQASRADEFDEEPCDSDDLDPAPVIHEIHEAPSAAYGGAEGPQAGAYAHGQQGRTG
ncbi:MAG: PspC domain-containing protein, partial [Firmicutes bacterium]|nr:PspC domain-containing protein [Bacillota bacterium]